MNSAKTVAYGEFINEVLAQQGLHYVLNSFDEKRLIKGPVIYLLDESTTSMDGLAVLRVLTEAGLQPKHLIDHRQHLMAALKDWYLPVNWNKTLESQIAFVGQSQVYVVKINLKKSEGFQQLSKVLRLGLKVVPVVIGRDKAPKSKASLLKIPGLSIERKTLTIRFGKPIGLSAHGVDAEDLRLSQFVKARMRALQSATIGKVELETELKEAAQIIRPVEVEALNAEIEALKQNGALLFSQAEFDIYSAKAEEIPQLMQEIGRMREVTFREVNEGSQNALDLDEYDLYYRQLIVWDREACKLVGGYRLGPGDEIMKSLGKKGFYIHSLFKIKNEFNPVLAQSLELGRSYVVPEYQRKRLPLFLLWKGILHFLLANPHYKYLIGPLSISQHYSNVSRHIIVEFVKRYFYDHGLAKHIKARKQFRYRSKGLDTGLLVDGFEGELKQLDNFIEEIEPEHFRIPILMKKYFNQNARIIGFNLDPDFSDVLDGLMLLRLDQLPKETMENLQG